MEKELESAVISQSSSRDSAEKVVPVTEGNTESRSQLKVKIKGPFSDANYTVTTTKMTSTINTLTQVPVIPLATIANVGNIEDNSNSRRRMRKKELLRQYWTQNMEAGDVVVPPLDTNTIGVGVNSLNSGGNAITSIPMITPQTVTTSAINRTVITIPKAVASMTSFPTRDDYKAVLDANSTVEKKEKKRGNFENFLILAILQGRLLKF